MDMIIKKWKFRLKLYLEVKGCDKVLQDELKDENQDSIQVVTQQIFLINLM